MQCPHCGQEVRDSALKCRHCRQLILKAPQSKKNTIWCSIGSLFFALMAWLLGAALAFGVRNELSCVADEESQAEFIVLQGFVVLIALLLSFWSIRKRYTAWWLCFISLFISGWSFWIVKELI